MPSVAPEYRPAEVERAARALWAARHLPASDGVIGRGTAPLVRQFEGTYTAGDRPGLIALRAVAADADARYSALAGRRAAGVLRREVEEDADRIGPILESLSVWTGGAAGRPYEAVEHAERVEAIVGRMAERGLLLTRDAPLRVCSYCAAPRSPERIIYQEEEGDTFLVRFPVAGGEESAHALVWVDAPWRLLGVTALLLNPTLPYVVARYRRKGVEERILSSRSSLLRLAAWLPGAEFEIVEEGPGSRWAGHAYGYPLRSEFPMGAELAPPAGTVQTVPDVGDSGTGIVPLVPGHGGTDAQIAERLGILGWPLVTPHGLLATTLVHKYAGLDLPTASEFVLRDLADGGAVFARLRVRRGVPRCAICGTALVWAPGRAWCLEPGRLPAEWAAVYRRLLPREPPLSEIEIAAWPVSETTPKSPGPRIVSLLECPACERLAPVGGEAICPCGAARRPVGRRLLPAIQGVLEAWAGNDPFPAGDSVRLYLDERRRAPALVHHLAVISGVEGVPRDVGLTLLPGGPEASLPELVRAHGADAVRGALLRGGDAPSGAPLGDRCAQEARFLRRFWRLAHEIFDRMDPATRTAVQPPIDGFLPELESEDLAILARWERVRVGALADYDRHRPGRAYLYIGRFLANALPEYRALVAPRLGAADGSAEARPALRTLQHLLRSAAVLLAPVAPHTAEDVYAAATTAGTSLFEATVRPVEARLLDEARGRAWDRWRSVAQACDRYRRSVGVAPKTPLPRVVVVVDTDPLADELRTEAPTIQRLAGIDRFEACGPGTPWAGRQRDVEPVLAEIQKVYPSEATVIAHLLRRNPPGRRGDGSAGSGLEVILQGQPRRILPAMVSYVERLPDRFVPVGWPDGQMYIERPSVGAPPGRVPPPVSSDLFHLLRTVERERRRRSSHPGAATGPVVVAAADPLAAELRQAAPALAAYLGVSQLRVVDAGGVLPPRPSFEGRTRAGQRWRLYLPGLAAPRPRTKAHRVRSAASRVRAPQPPAAPPAEVDYASPEEVAHAEEVRSLMQEMDGLLGAPLLGFAKTDGAWAAGFRRRADFESAPFDSLAALPGFGRPLAESLLEKLGRAPPPRRPVVRPSVFPRAPPRTSPGREPTSPPTERASAEREVPLERSAIRETGTPPRPSAVPLPPPVPSGAAGEPPAASGAGPPGDLPPFAPGPGVASEPGIPPSVPESDPAPSASAGRGAEPGSPPARSLALPPDPLPPLGFETHPTREILPDPVIPGFSDPGASPPLEPDVPPGAASAPDAPNAPGSPDADPLPVSPAELASPASPAPPPPPEGATGGAGALPIGLSPPVPSIPAPGAETATEEPAPGPEPPDPRPEPSTDSPSDAPLPEPVRSVEPSQGGVELVIAPTYLPALAQFLEATGAGHRGIAIVRESPERIRTRIGQRPAEVYWLTNLGRGPTLKPGDLDRLRSFLEAAVERDGVRAFFFEGLEYLIRLHGVERVAAVLEEFHGRARRREVRAWVCLHPGLIAPADLDRLAVAFPRP